MFCDKCGAPNSIGAKYCEKCGQIIEVKDPQSKKKLPKNIEETKEKALKQLNNFNSLPKKNKIIMGIVSIVVIISLIVLCILLNNPVKKVEDCLVKYYDNYEYNSEETNEYLIEIGKILKSNKKDNKVLTKIKNTAHSSMNKWVKNFNTDYKDLDDLSISYKKTSNALKDIYSYFDGLKYMLDKTTYTDYRDELNELYKSKKNYLEGQESEDNRDFSHAYSYYQEVTKNDSYYNKAQKFIIDYIKEEIANVKSYVEKLTTNTDKSSDEEILTIHINILKYLEDNKYTKDYIDLSTSSEYQELYNNSVKIIVEKTTTISETLAKDLDYDGAVETIERALKALDNNRSTEEYKNLIELKEKFSNNLPDSLLDKLLISETWNSGVGKYSKVINDTEYKNNIYFEFAGENEHRTYRLNGEYKRFKTKIVRGEDWDKEFSGTIVIYGDDKELYRSENITKSSELKPDIDIDITGIDDLKIEFITSSKPSSNISFYIYLVEPYLYK